jgi:hypothetical protein
LSGKAHHAAGDAAEAAEIPSDRIEIVTFTHSRVSPPVRQARDSIIVPTRSKGVTGTRVHAGELNIACETRRRFGRIRDDI